MGAWGRFWAWYENKILGSIIIIAIIQFIQIPHMVWNADLYLSLGVVSRVHPVIDWLLYGVDLIETISIVNVGMIMYSMLKKRRARRAGQAAGEEAKREPAREAVKHGRAGFCPKCYTDVELARGPGGDEATGHCPKCDTDIESAPEGAPVKQAIVVRTDLDMGKGKIAAQVGHACVMGAMRVREARPEWFEAWRPSQAKVVLRVGSLVELEGVKRAAAEAGAPWDMVSDAGLTQLEPGTVTCMAVGPAPDALVDRVTGDLRLL